MNVFNLSPGPTRDAPSAPLDVRRCDVVLVEFDILIENPPQGLNDQYLPIAVRSLSKEDNGKTPELYIPLAAEDTLNTIIRQGWESKIGVKLSFLHSSRAAPYQEELAAVLDWILTFHSQQNPALRVVVIDVNIGTVKSSDFAMINTLYGSKLELIPGLSADMLVDVTRGYNVKYKHFKFSEKDRCSKLISIYGRNGNLLYRRDVNATIPECHEASVSSQNCIVCRDGDIIIICPNSVQPAKTEDSVGGVLNFQQLHNRTQPYILTSEQDQAETTLQDLGLLVLSHGAFLNLDSISVFPHSKTGCEQVKPGRWGVGEYAPEDPYAIRIPRDEQYPERTGLLVFEELCKRSNNRAGIVVSVPSADYIPAAGCKWVQLVNRHVKTDTGGSGDNKVHYSMRDLAGIISDMAKWGVCRYSLGYLDYTFGNSEGMPTLTQLSHIINSAATKIRTLHYRYTRTSNFRDGGYSYAHVDGVYKLEGGMFFQRVAEGIPLTKSFAAVPDMPNLRLGISSDMNVGAPLPGSELINRDIIEKVKFIPYGAHVINLNYKDMVAFIDQDRDRIYIHSPSTVVRSDGLRLPSFGIQIKLAVQLNTVTFAFQGAHQRLLSCAQGVQRSDMTGCEPGFLMEFHTDIPVASRSLSSSRLVMVVKRESWNPVLLSHWYMPFIDSSKGNRTCWLDRPMVSDKHANYRVPPCDSRGICEPLELDDETVSACEVNENGEISLDCPVVCGTPCFGPICYQPQSDTYTLRTASVAARGIVATNDLSLVW